jgi:hypothetical protein
MEDLLEAQALHGEALEESNNLPSQIVFIDCCSPHVSDWVDSLIGPSGLLLLVSHPFAVSVSVLLVGLEKSLSMKDGSLFCFVL